MLRPLFTITPVERPSQAARVYVPVTLVNRALAALRFLVVAWLLGSAGKSAFGQYNVALETINWLVALVLFGVADVAERYVSAAEQAGQTRTFLMSHGKRLLLVGGATILVLGALAPWLGDPKIVILVGLNVAVLAFYQWLAGALRGLRAYAAAAGMELLAALLLVILSAGAAWTGRAAALLAAYLVANMSALIGYGWMLHRYTASAGAAADPTAGPPAVEPAVANRSSFARWSLVRLLLVMTFALLSVWSVRWLAERSALPSAGPASGVSAAVWRQKVLEDGNIAAADYAMPYRIAQMLAFAGVTFWASSYGIAARHWSHGRRRRAQVELLKIGNRGGVALLVAATVLVISRGIIQYVLPATYHDSINELLPGLLGVFLWYAMTGFFSVYGDLTERPWIGAVLWGTAVAVQAGMIAAAGYFGLKSAWGQLATPEAGGMVVLQPDRFVLLASALGLGVAALVAAPLLLWRAPRMSATAVPLGLVVLAALAFQAPNYVVDMLTGLLTCLVLGFLWTSGLLRR